MQNTNEMQFPLGEEGLREIDYLKGETSQLFIESNK